MTNKRKRIEFKSNSQTQQEIYDRQGGKCALSGEPLNSSAELHHVVTAGHGGRRNRETVSFVEAPRRNGVLVNREREIGDGQSAEADSQHLEAHGGKFNNGSALLHREFLFSHGGDMKAHEDWARKNESFVDEKIFNGNPSPSWELRDEVAKHNESVSAESVGVKIEQPVKARGKER